MTNERRAWIIQALRIHVEGLPSGSFKNDATAIVNELASQPAPSGWQQRIAAMLEAISAADTYACEALAAVREPRWIDEKTVDLRPIHDALQAVCAALRTAAVDAGQHAKDAPPPSSSEAGGL